MIHFNINISFFDISRKTKLYPFLLPKQATFPIYLNIYPRTEDAQCSIDKIKKLRS